MTSEKQLLVRVAPVFADSYQFALRLYGRTPPRCLCRTKKCDFSLASHLDNRKSHTKFLLSRYISSSPLKTDISLVHSAGTNLDMRGLTGLRWQQDLRHCDCEKTAYERKVARARPITQARRSSP